MWEMDSGPFLGNSWPVPLSKSSALHHFSHVSVILLPHHKVRITTPCSTTVGSKCGSRQDKLTLFSLQPPLGQTFLLMEWKPRRKCWTWKHDRSQCKSSQLDEHSDPDTENTKRKKSKRKYFDEGGSEKSIHSLLKWPNYTSPVWLFKSV